MCNLSDKPNEHLLVIKVMRHEQQDKAKFLTPHRLK